MKKTILFVMTRLPFPSTSGRKNELYNYCKILSEKLGYRVVIASFLEDGIDINKQKPSFIDKIVILPSIKMSTKISNILKYSLLTKKFPMQASLYWDKNVDGLIKKIVELEKPFVVISDMIRMTEYIRNLDCYKIADLEDRISLRYRRELDYSIEDVNPYGAYLSSMPKIVQKFLLLKPLKLFVMKNEIKLIEKYELEIGRQCDKVIFVAEGESKTFNEQLNDSKAATVPIGVDTNYFKYQGDSDVNETYIGFLGKLDVAHNETAVKYFVEEIFPIIKSKDSSIKFLIIGGGKNEKLLKYKSKDVIFTGMVDDVREYLKKCKVFVCPLTFGSGIKTKNLEAMAMQLPVVTTSIGAENINAKNMQDWIVTDDKEEFANSVVNLVNDDKMRKEMGRNASKYINDNFTWDVAEKRLKEILEKV